MAKSLLDLGNKLKDLLWSATPVGQTYNAVQKAVPKIQQGIQDYGARNTRAAGFMLKAEPAYNAIQGAIRSIPAAPSLITQKVQSSWPQIQNAGNQFAQNTNQFFQSGINKGYSQAPFQVPTPIKPFTVLPEMGREFAKNTLTDWNLGLTTGRPETNRLNELTTLPLKTGKFRTPEQEKEFRDLAMNEGLQLAMGMVGGGEKLNTQKNITKAYQEFSHNLGAVIKQAGRKFSQEELDNAINVLAKAPIDSAPDQYHRNASAIARYIQGVKSGVLVNKPGGVGLQAKPLRPVSEAEKAISQNKKPPVGQPTAPQEPISVRGNTVPNQKTIIPIQKTVGKFGGNEANPAKSLAETIAQTARGGKLKERKFITTVKESGKTAEPVKQMVEGFYIPKSNDALSRAAQKQIMTDINVARQKALTELNDEAVATANELVSHYSAQGDYESAAYVANTVAQNLTEAGRAVQAASLYDKLTPDGIQRFAASQLNKVKMQLKPDDAKRLYAMAVEVQKMPAGTPKAMAQQKLLQEVSGLIPTPLITKLTTLWKAGLLTGLKTTGRNITSNTINNVAEIVKDVPATLADMLASTVTGKRSKVFTTRGYGSGLLEGAKKGAQYLTTGFDERRMIDKLDTRTVNWGKSIVGKAAKAYTDTVFRFLGAQDQPFYYAALRRSLNDQAMAKAINAGRRGDRAFIQGLISNPTEDMIRTSVMDAEKAVFQNKTALGSAINKAKTAFNKQSPLAGAVAEFVMPFTGVPSAVASQVINYTPVGIVKTIIENIGKGKFDQRQLVEGLGRGITGTGIMAIGSALMAQGLMTLDRPASEKERQQWELEGKQPFSILYNGKWRSIGSLGPQAQALITGAYAQQGGVGQAALGALKSQKEQTFLKGISSLTDAIDNPKGYAHGYAQSALGGFIPTIVGNVAQASDPYQREVNSIPEALKNRIPGLRDDLLMRRNAFGEPMQNEQGFIGSMIDIFNSSPIKSSIIINELRRLNDLGMNVTPSKIDKVQTVSGQKVELTSQLQDVLESKAGPAIKQIWESVIQSKDYQALSDDNKSKLLQNIIESVRKVEKLGVTAQVNPSASAEALLDLTKNERTYLTTGTLPIKLPKEKEINQLTPSQIELATDILTSNDPDKTTKLAELIAQTSKGKKAKKISIKKITPKTIRVSLPKSKKPSTLKISAPPKPKTQKSSKRTAVFKIKPIKAQKLIGLTAGKKLV